MTRDRKDAADLLRDLVARLDGGRLAAADELAAGLATLLTSGRAPALPPAAEARWREVLRRHFKADPERGGIPPAALAAMRSWPQARVDEVVAALRAILDEIERAENDRLNDAVRTDVARAYL